MWDFVYGGGPDYFYRLHIGSLPHIDAVIPAAVKPGEKTTVTVLWPQPARRQTRPERQRDSGPSAGDDYPRDRSLRRSASALSLHTGEAMRPPRRALDGMAYRLTTPEGSSNPIFIGFTNDPIVLENEPNNDLKSAQRLSIPCEVTGTFAPAGDLDYYSFPAKKGEKLVVEILRRTTIGPGRPVPVRLRRDGQAYLHRWTIRRAISAKSASPPTRATPAGTSPPPADGDYFVQVRDLYHQQRGDIRFTYRLSLRRLQPDFRLIVVPVHDIHLDSTVVSRGGNHWMDVLAFRNDDFDAPITVEASNLPPGVTCEPVVIAPGKTSAPLVFHARARRPAWQRRNQGGWQSEDR